MSDKPVPGDIIAHKASTITPERMRWLWPYRFPLGKLSVLAGRQGIGKSTVAADMAARVSAGAPWPDWDGDHPAGDVLMVGFEDGYSDTVVPRLAAAGADLDRVHLSYERWVYPRVQRTGAELPERATIVLPDALDGLSRLLESMERPRLVVVDPLDSFFPPQTDTKDAKDVLGIMNDLDGWAARHDVCLLALLHIKKGEADAGVFRVSGSIKLTSRPRAVWMVQTEATNPDGRMLVSGKTNFRPAPGLRFEIASTDQDAGRVHWLEGEAEETADEAFRPAQERRKARRVSKAAAAVAWLREYLSNGPRLRDEVEAAAGVAGHNWSTLDKASRGAVEKQKQDPSNNESPWIWRLPAETDMAA